MNLSHRIFAVSLLALVVMPLSALKEKAPLLSQKAAVSQRIGLDTDITVIYSRPGVKNRTIWGKLVPFGMAPGDEYSNNKPYPWRGGANECTTIELSKAVLIQGNLLNEGKYSVHFIPSQEDWVVIFNKNTSLWGSYKYNQSEDALRIRVTPVQAPHQEWLLYGFESLSDYGAVAFLHWEKLKVPFAITCPGS